MDRVDRDMVGQKSKWVPRFCGLIRGEGQNICIFLSFRYSASILISLCRIKVPSRFSCVTSTSSATMLLVDPGLCSWV